MQQKRTYLVTLLYFIQKMSYTITSTIALTYERIPNYFVLSIFELSYLPFSAKFLFGNGYFLYSSYYRKVLLIDLWQEKNMGSWCLFLHGSIPWNILPTHRLLIRSYCCLACSCSRIFLSSTRCCLGCSCT